MVGMLLSALSETRSSMLKIVSVSKREYVAWLIVYCNFFFLRTSVMMFVLRLLPAFKKVQKWVVYVALAVNFAITIVVTVSYGLSCMPLRAEWENIPGAKCYSKDVLVITSIVNGGMRIWQILVRRTRTYPHQHCPVSSTLSRLLSRCSFSGTSR